MYNRAHVSQKTVEEILEEIVDESLAKHEKISKSLEITSAKALALWERFLNGYMYVFRNIIV